MNNPHTPFTARCIANTEVAQDTRILSFEAIENAPESFQTGQFFLYEADPKTHRAYSIASSPEQMPRFDLAVKLLEGGAASEQFRVLEEGQKVTFRGPMGKFRLKHAEADKVFVATGTGLAPMRAFWQELLPQAVNITLIFGLSYEANLFCVDELTELMRQYPQQLNCTFCVSREAVSGMHHGRVTDYSQSLPQSFWDGKEVALCGSKPMVDEMKQILSDNGVAKEMIEVESW